MEGTRLLNLDEPIEFIPQSEADRERPFKFYIVPLDWYEAMSMQGYYKSYINEDDNIIVEIKPEHKDHWNQFILSKLTKITEGDTELPLDIETMKRIPPLAGIDLLGRVFKMVRGVTEEQEKN